MTIKEYWNLIGREPFLAITWEPDFSQACSFCRMFHFAQTPDKTNDMIFLKSPKTMFLGHFWPFSAVTHNYIWAPNTMLSFRKKLMSQFWENLRTDGRTEGQTLFHRSSSETPGGPKNKSWCTVCLKTP